MRQDVKDSGPVDSLFRRKAVRAAAERLFGSVAVVVPPSAVTTLAVAILALAALAAVAWLVEIPQRARAVGVLMPSGGFLDIVADAPGRVASVAVSDGQAVQVGDQLMEFASDRPGLVKTQLRSLHAELRLLERANERQAVLDDEHSASLATQRRAVDSQLAVANGQLELQRQQVALLERRLARRRGLAHDGNLSADALEREQGLLLQARAASAALERSIIDLGQQSDKLGSARVAALNEAERRRILQAVERRRLQRRADEQSFLLKREFSSPEAATVARVFVRPGDAVSPGNVLVRMVRGAAELEAWLYLPSSKAAFLHAGQTVQIRLDAYPHQLFGTSTAVVRAVSEIAVVPRELRVPLLLNGPVFEVRATLDTAHVEAFASVWQLAPGASFQADVVQRRYRLYEWLLRAIVRGRDTGRA